MPESEKLTSWLVINGAYDSRKENPAEHDAPGYQRVHWNDVLNTLRDSGAKICSTMSEAEAVLSEEPEVVIIQGHSSTRDASKRVYLWQTDHERIHPGQFPPLRGCRLLWLDTCYGNIWLDAGLRERLTPGTIVVSTSTAQPEAYARGAEGIRSLAYWWLYSRGPRLAGELQARVHEIIEDIPDRGIEPQNLRVSIA